MIKLKLKDGTTYELISFMNNGFQLYAKLEYLEELFESLSRDNMKGATIINGDSVSHTYGYMDLESCNLEFGETLKAGIMFTEVPDSEIELGKARAKQDAMRKVFLIGMNHADPEDVVEWCEELDGWHEAKYPYKKGDRFKHNGKPYEALIDLVSDPDIPPEKNKALYKEITKENKPVYPEWKPGMTGQKGERYIYAGDIWECTWENNSRNPGGLGWKKV
nr:MAG TPA: chitinase C [Caudoviricetes sp.]